jgi:hypothetical protein
MVQKVAWRLRVNSDTDNAYSSRVLRDGLLSWRWPGLGRNIFRDRTLIEQATSSLSRIGRIERQIWAPDLHADGGKPTPTAAYSPFWVSIFITLSDTLSSHPCQTSLRAAPSRGAAAVEATRRPFAGRCRTDQFRLTASPTIDHSLDHCQGPS